MIDPFIIKKYAYMCGLQQLSESVDRLHFKCPLCGDSRKSAKKKRGWILFNKQYPDGQYKCFNCGVGTSFKNFIITHYSHLYDGLRQDMLESAFNDIVFNKDDYVKKTETPSRDISFVKNNTLLKKLPKVKEIFDGYSYLQKRLIPEEFINQLYYSDHYINFLAENGLYDSEFIPRDDRRIVIPIYQNNELVFLQGRSIEENAFLRYITKTIKEGYVKFWGLDTHDKFKTGYLFEGILDACFLKNSVSCCGGSFVSTDILNISKNIVYCPDGDIYTNKDIKKQSLNYVNEGGKLFIMPESDARVGKDINKLIEKGYSIERIQQMIDNNTFSGPSAIIRLKNMM
jgi:hypothetical protein